MGTFNHVLKPNKTGQFPRNWVWFDCEAAIKKDKAGGETHTLRLGVLWYQRDSHHNKQELTAILYFRDPMEFWLDVTSNAEKDRHLVLIGYNVGYDMRLVDGFHCLAKLGYEQTKVFVSQGGTILDFHNGTHRLTVLDAMNYFDGKLETWGKMLGLHKGEVDFRKASDETLFKYCRRDVEILRLLWLKWRAFLDDNDLGHFCVTRASQALTAFRHRFMQEEIFIHANKPIAERERKAYFGGRTECFHIGRPKGRSFWKLDINSMYPYIMSTVPVPIKYKYQRYTPQLSQVKKALSSLAVVAEVELDTDKPIYPIRKGFDLIFPIGSFVANLTTPELEQAFKRGHVRKILWAAAYDKAILFRDYVKTLYRLRKGYDREGNRIFSQMVKYLMNSLYGKFGQHSEQWVKVGDCPTEPDGAETVFDLDSGQWRKEIRIAGESWHVLGRSDSYHTFTAISAHITAASRMYLWQLIESAGRCNVFYCDTDSLIVNASGRKRLTKWIDPDKLGMLKVEYRTRKLNIQSPKSYSTDRETHCKGIKPDAVLLAKDVFRQMQWQGLTGAITSGNTDKVILVPIVKHNKNLYRKGVVHPSGSVAPFRLDVSANSSNRN